MDLALQGEVGLNPQENEAALKAPLHDAGRAELQPVPPGRDGQSGDLRVVVADVPLKLVTLRKERGGEAGTDDGGRGSGAHVVCSGGDVCGGGSGD